MKNPTTHGRQDLRGRTNSFEVEQRYGKDFLVAEVQDAGIAAAAQQYPVEARPLRRATRENRGVVERAENTQVLVARDEEAEDVRYVHGALEHERGYHDRRAGNRGIPAARMGYPPAPGAPPLERWLGQLLSWIGPLREIAEHGVMWLPVSRRGRLLDVGCGSGLFLERMRDFGWQVAGVEPDAPAARADSHSATRLSTATAEALEGQPFRVSWL